MLYDYKLIDRIKDHLVNDKKTLAVAESVTAGHMQAAFSSAMEASRFFEGGITVYNAGQKTRQLDVEPINALENDSVNERVAIELATGVTRKFLSDYGISITGYASIVPEKDINELFAFFAIAKQNEVLFSERITSSQTDPVDAQIDYCNQVIKKFAEILKVN